MKAKDLVPDALKTYVKLVMAKLRYRNCFIASPAIGRGVRLGRACSIAPLAELGDNVSIGDFSYVNRGSIIASGTLGSFCSVGPDVLIGMPEHPLDRLSTSPRLYGSSNLFGVRSNWNEFPSPPEIGSDVWFGASSFVKQGVQIGHGAVIAAGAVVTHDVPPFGIAAGVPARVIRYRFDSATAAEILASRWWEKDLAELAAIQDRFHHALQTRTLWSEQETIPL